MTQFYDYSVRHTEERDVSLAAEWSNGNKEKATKFWIESAPGRENFLVSEKRDEISLACHPAMSKVVYENEYPLALFQTQTVGTNRDQVRLSFQASPTASPKKILRGITKLVPLIEKALALRGVRAIFFTSQSLSMAAFMADRMGYRYAGDGGQDGTVMAKGIGGGIR